MNVLGPRRIVLLGMITKMPVPGVLWQTLHYLIGFRRLGYDVLYVEAHARTPSMFEDGSGKGSERAARFLQELLRPWGLGDRWALEAHHDDGACWGLDARALHAAYDDADVIVNLHGGTRPREEHARTGRLVLVATDPVQIEIELWQKKEETRAILDAHVATFSFGENYGRPGCELPVSDHYRPHPTRQPVLLDLWDHDRPAGERYTTVANWRQPYRTLRYRKETYHWSKDREFLKVLGLPARTGAEIELTLASAETADRELLEGHGWHVRDASALGIGLEPYRGYVQGSRGEFTVAKDQNVRLKSGWFSDRSATYLAAGRPVVTQDTGFGAFLPTGAGLFAFEDEDQAVAAIETIETDHGAACAAARAVARECFDYRVVLPPLLAAVGVEGARPAPRAPHSGLATADGCDDSRDEWAGFPESLRLTPRSRRPLELEEATVKTILARPLPERAEPRALVTPPPPGDRVSVIVLTYDHLHLSRLCLETLLAHTRHPGLEVVVVDNGSTDGTRAYLAELAGRDPRLRLIFNTSNEGFAGGCNIGASAATGDVLVFLNNDTVLPPGWLGRLVRHLDDPGVGAVNPVTNRIGTEAQVQAEDGTYGGFLRDDRERARARAGELREAEMLAFFCLAIRRQVWEDVGPLDQGFGAGMFEDDDYSVRLREAGFRLGCAEDVYVHHFGEATYGDLVPDGRYGELFQRNRQRFERKWGRTWDRPGATQSSGYEAMVGRLRAAVASFVEVPAPVAVVSRGDRALVDLQGCEAWHFPRAEDGTWAGHYPADGPAAVRALEDLRRRGAGYLLIPRTGFWWLDHYHELRDHLEATARELARTDDLLLFSLNGVPMDQDGSRTGEPSRPRPGEGAAPRPVFIVGSPRSGTSILTWALGQHSNLYPVEETAWFGHFHKGASRAYQVGSSRGELSQISAMGIERAEFMADLGRALDQVILRHREWPNRVIGSEQAFARARSPDEPKARWVDGTPQNSFDIMGLAEMFPEAVFIHLVRRPDLVARSLRRFHAIGGREHTADEAYRKWSAHVRACLDAERRLGPGRIMRAMHREMEEAPEGLLRRCLEFAGEAFDERCLLPLAHRINSSGNAPLSDPSSPEEPGDEALEEASALAEELFDEEVVGS